VRVRSLGGGVVRVRLPRPLPLRAGDRAVLRDPGRRTVAAGLLVLDADPPPLRRRGAAAARAAELGAATGALDATVEVARRGAMRRAHLHGLGGVPPAGVQEVGDWLVAPDRWQRWVAAVEPAVQAWAVRNPLDPAVPVPALAYALGLPDDALAAPVAVASGLDVSGGRVHPAAVPASLGAAEEAVRTLEVRLGAQPFAAPEADELSRLGLGHRELSAAERTGRLLRLDGDVVLLPSAPDLAVSRLGVLPQPFTTSQARQAFRTTRRVAVPLLEHLDRLGRTERVDGVLRRLR
jgi:selenocysteine-specific elongation factor